VFEQLCLLALLSGIISILRAPQAERDAGHMTSCRIELHSLLEAWLQVFKMVRVMLRLRPVAARAGPCTPTEEKE
jgi:hypothetical protein